MYRFFTSLIISATINAKKYGHNKKKTINIIFWFMALINGFIGFGALYGVAGMVALFGGADVVTSGFSAG
ncbi:hypothetical protein, partial [Caldibacillus sp. 210928-DFI.2.22]|uniref:hypothetical protein n=1 Tax=Caldibacillus sp. 210928-DFI.2.22 TaxID=2883265 RepID=UPI001D08E732